MMTELGNMFLQLEGKSKKEIEPNLFKKNLKFMFIKFKHFIKYEHPMSIIWVNKEEKLNLSC